MSTQPRSLATEDFLGGEAVEVEPITEAHALVVANLIAALAPAVRGVCRVYSSGLSVGVAACPDVSIVCGDGRFRDDRKDVLLNPTAIIELLSPPSGGSNVHRYRRITSLVDYILVSQVRALVEQWTRLPDNQWLLQDVEGLDARLRLASVDCEIPLAEIYRDVEFPQS